ncbi:MAG: hypothetical protein AABM42_04290 [Actinomycetota bacterium]
MDVTLPHVEAQLLLIIAVERLPEREVVAVTDLLPGQSPAIHRDLQAVADQIIVRCPREIAGVTQMLPEGNDALSQKYGHCEH